MTGGHVHIRSVRAGVPLIQRQSINWPSSNLWLGAVALVRGVQFALDAVDHAIGEPVGAPLPFILIFSLDLMNLGMMAAMIGSVVSTRRRTAAARRA